jgi:hypothetical protein
MDLCGGLSSRGKEDEASLSLFFGCPTLWIRSLGLEEEPRATVSWWIIFLMRTQSEADRKLARIKIAQAERQEARTQTRVIHYRMLARRQAFSDSQCTEVSEETKKVSKRKGRGEIDRYIPVGDLRISASRSDTASTSSSERTAAYRGRAAQPYPVGPSAGFPPPSQPPIRESTVRIRRETVEWTEVGHTQNGLDLVRVTDRGAQIWSTLKRVRLGVWLESTTTNPGPFAR